MFRHWIYVLIIPNKNFVDVHSRRASYFDLDFISILRRVASGSFGTQTLFAFFFTNAEDFFLRFAESEMLSD